ncbi:MAG: glycosyltransferase family 2 protein [Terriglobia bacterium]
MAETPYLSDDFLRQLTAAGGVDILVAVPTSNNRETIEHVVDAIQGGLMKYFPRERAALINPDAGSRDGTVEALKAAALRDDRGVLAAGPLRSVRTLTASFHPSQGHGGALRLVLAAADLLRAKACAVVSADLSSITPEWIDALIRPVYREHFDFLAPVYERRPFEGLLVRNLLSPVVRAAYGFRIEEPAPGEMGFSGDFACHFLAQDVWREDVMRHGASTWMTTTALTGNFRVCQSFLGPKTSAAKHPTQNLATAIQNAVGAVFQSLEAHQDVWPGLTGSRSVPSFGTPSSDDLGPDRLNQRRMFEMFRSGTTQITSILERILSAQTLEGIRGVAAGSDGHFPDDLWVKTVYEFAAAFHRRTMNRDHLLQALTPIYRGRISSFLRESHGAGVKTLEERREALQLEFERMKPYLVEGWCGKA